MMIEKAIAGEECGGAMMMHIAELFPISRSITGEGLRETLRYVGKHMDLTIHEVPSGTPVLDWSVPREWVVRGGTIKDRAGHTIVDFSDNNLHLVNYSRPFCGRISRDELESHLHSLPDQPDLIPYRTGYYVDDWGFCLQHRLRERMGDAEYDVFVDTELVDGSLSYAEHVLPGDEAAEVLLSVHCCHPSLANDNLSGIALAIELSKRLADRPRRFTYRFVFVPGTIGSLAWLSRNLDAPKRVRHGLVISCVGDPAPPTYKRSRQHMALIDRYAAHVLGSQGHIDRVQDFSPYGYDERQYCSPGFNLAVGCFMRSPNGTFPEYHTSADNLTFVRPDSLLHSLETIDEILQIAERDRIWRNLSPYGEPQLGKRGLYKPIGGQSDISKNDQMSLLWLLNLADGHHSVLDIAERSGQSFHDIAAAAEKLKSAGLLAEEI
jgi:aminopeptidase-like protein